MTIRIARAGVVTLADFEARLSAYLNAGAPKPVLENPRDERRLILEQVAARGDAQMKSHVQALLEADREP